MPAWDRWPEEAHSETSARDSNEAHEPSESSDRYCGAPLVPAALESVLVSRFVEVGRDQAAAAIGNQFPQSAALPLTRVHPGGSDHVIYRLGDAMTVRFPRHPGAVDQARREARWLLQLADHLPLAIPLQSLSVNRSPAIRGTGRSTAGSMAAL